MKKKIFLILAGTAFLFMIASMYVSYKTEKIEYYCIISSLLIFLEMLWEHHKMKDKKNIKVW